MKKHQNYNYYLFYTKVVDNADTDSSDESTTATANGRLENALKLIGFLVTILSLGFTAINYYSAERWKVAEFTAQKYKEFHENPSVRVARSLIEFEEREVALLGPDSITKVNEEMLYRSLVIDTVVVHFSRAEARIRDIFDDYFTELTLFNIYVKSGLMRYRDIRPYFDYYVGILADPANQRKPKRIQQHILDYLCYYEFYDVLELYRGFGYKPTVYCTSKY